MGVAARAGGINSLTDTLAAAAPSLHGLVIKGPMLFASRRQHRMCLCALRTLHLPSRSTSATSSRIQTDTVEYCEEILYPHTQFPKQSTSGHPVVYSPLIKVAPHTAFTLSMTKAKKCTSDEFERDQTGSLINPGTRPQA